jgi:hypothetical protein
LNPRAAQDPTPGDTPSAFQALGQHESEFASGALGPEAEVLRIQALLARREYNSAAVIQVVATRSSVLRR